MEEVDNIVSNWTKPLNRSAIFNLLISKQVPCSPVRDLNEVMNDEHLHARGSLQWVDHPDYGRMPAAASPLRFNGQASLPSRFSVPLGADSKDILKQFLNMSDEQIQPLEKNGVI
ncbi:MAG: hypothetical protein EBT78_18110 [Betaproteobacteria bacterium]|nr:hypothetical protein [Betaproteobacteria bacterium]